MFSFCPTFRVRHAEPETLKAERGSAEVLSVAAGWAPWFSFGESVFLRPFLSPSV